ncbi:MAG TPA: hypothetical protein VIX84_22685 [Acidimicrobiales bacterium]
MTTEESIQAYFAEKVPQDWFTAPAAVDSDSEEILCVGVLPPETSVDEFRERTRQARMAVASEAEARFGRKVSWGVERDGVTMLFTTQSTPVMTRLRLRERKVLDTLIEAGVARSRSEALAWCVKLVERHQGDWLAELREALVGVAQVRTEGPTLL